MPGHSSEVLRAYPEVACLGADGKPVYSSDVCPGSEETFKLFQSVLDEVIEIFPSRLIHIGGDEAPRDRWKACPHCQSRIRAEHLANEAQLQSWLILQAEKHLALKGRKIIGWDEILDGGVAPSTMVQSWRGTSGGKRAASLGNKVIMSPNIYLYLDYYQTPDPAAYGEPLAIGHYVSLQKVYSFNPYEGLKARERPFIHGIQANLWAEYLPSFDLAQERLLPRLAALSEVAWSTGERERYEDFLERCRCAMLPLYAEFGWKWGPYAFLFADLENLQ